MDLYVKLFRSKLGNFAHEYVRMMFPYICYNDKQNHKERFYKTLAFDFYCLADFREQKIERVLCLEPPLEPRVDFENMLLEIHFQVKHRKYLWALDVSDNLMKILLEFLMDQFVYFLLPEARRFTPDISTALPWLPQLQEIETTQHQEHSQWFADQLEEIEFFWGE